MRKYIFSGLAIAAAISMPLVAGAAIQSPIKSDNLYDFLNGIMGVSLKVIFPIAVIIVLIAAFLILRAQGDSKKIGDAKKMLTFGLAGVAIVILGAGSSALLMNIFGIKAPGITSQTTEAEMQQMLNDACNNPDLLANVPELKAACEEKQSINQCVAQ